MDWLIVLAFILLGLVLIAAEIIFIPGTTVIGFVGFFTAVGGIYYGYKIYDTATGHAILVGTTVVGGIMTYLSFKFEVWRMFALKENIEGKVTTNVKINIEEGKEGITTSALRPMGSAEIDGEIFEVKTYGSYVEANQKIRIIRVDNDTIIVEPF